MKLTATQFFSLRDQEVDAAIETQFYGRLRMRNGTFKLTKSARFRDVEAAVAQAISARAANLRTVLDVGVSTGITTIEFCDFLRSMGARPQITATDLFIDAHIVEPFVGVRVLADPTGWPLEYDLFGRSFRAAIGRWDYVTLTVFLRLLARVALRHRLKSMIDRGKSKPVKFLSARLANRDDISVIDNDILTQSENMVGKFDLVRAANILNRGYFSDENIARAVATVRSYLRHPGGMLLVTRTKNDEVNSGTLFELTEDRTFTSLVRIGDGSEIDSIVLGMS